MDGGDRERRRSRRGEARREARGGVRSVWPGMLGGRYRPLSDEDCATIHEIVVALLERTGFSDAPPAMVARAQAHGAALTEAGRLVLPWTVVEQAIGASPQAFSLFGRGEDGRRNLDLSDARVHTGSGGAAPMVVDLETGRHRTSNLKDLYDAARLVDALDNVHFFSRSLVARGYAGSAVVGSQHRLCVIGGDGEACLRERLRSCACRADRRDVLADRGWARGVLGAAVLVLEREPCRAADALCAGGDRRDGGRCRGWAAGPRQCLRTSRRVVPRHPDRVRGAMLGRSAGGRRLCADGLARGEGRMRPAADGGRSAHRCG